MELCSSRHLAIDGQTLPYRLGKGCRHSGVGCSLHDALLAKLALCQLDLRTPSSQYTGGAASRIPACSGLDTPPKPLSRNAGLREGEASTGVFPTTYGRPKRLFPMLLVAIMPWFPPALTTTASISDPSFTTTKLTLTGGRPSVEVEVERPGAIGIHGVSACGRSVSEVGDDNSADGYRVDLRKVAVIVKLSHGHAHLWADGAGPPNFVPWRVNP